MKEVERTRAKGAPCKRACPAGVDIPRYNRLLSLGKFDEALAVILEKIPFPMVCGYVCPRFCEAQCRLGDMESPMVIRALHRFVAERATAYPESTVAKPTGKSVAIIGSGPAGLTAASYLVKLGHRVTVYEALSQPGGMMRVGIPNYRLPKDVVNKEIEAIERLGIEIKTNTKIESLDKLLTDGYDAVFIAIGAHKGAKMKVEGEDTPGVIDCISMLKDVNLGKEVRLGRRVVVIGGGNSAVDAARTCLRLGAKEVNIIYRRSQQEMPADASEVEETIREGGKIQFLIEPIKIKGGNSGLKMECIRTKLGEVDASGRRRPEPISGSEFNIDTDTIISAIGETPDTPSQFGVAITDSKTLEVDPDTLATSKKGSFAGGDAMRGPASVIEAIADGRQAAISIDKYLGGKGNIDEILAPPEVEIMPQIPLSLCAERPQIPSLPVAERLRGFAGVELGLTESAAIAEAKRCL